MIKALYTFGVLVLIGAGGVFALCGQFWRDKIYNYEPNKGTILFKDFNGAAVTKTNDSKEIFSPLVKQAGDFALCINPPPPPKPVIKPPEPVNVVSMPPAIAAKVQPRFNLLATSCYRNRPERSIALIWEPGSGERWVRQGDSIAHYVVESIKDGVIVCKDGQELREIVMETKPSVQIAQSRGVLTGTGEKNLR
jgi:hypothetical protein